MDGGFERVRSQERYGFRYSAEPRDIHDSRLRDADHLRLPTAPLEAREESSARAAPSGLRCRGLVSGLGGLVLVEYVHGRVLLHVVVSVQMVLQLVVGVEGALNVVNGAHET